MKKDQKNIVKFVLVALILVIIIAVGICSYSKKSKQVQNLETNEQGETVQISEKDLIGYWTPGFDADSMVFSIENGSHYYASYQDNRIFDIGTWKLVEDTLNITSNGNPDVVVFSLVKREGDTLTMTDTSGMINSYKVSPEK